MKAFSDDTGTEYDSWEDLVNEESNGYLAIAIISNGKREWPWCVGPFGTKREAANARQRMKKRWGKSQHMGDYSVTFYVRPAWKTTSNG